MALAYSSLPTLRRLGVCDYQATWHAMRDYSRSRSDDSDDELWLLEHPPVYTLGRNAERGHLARTQSAGDVPIIRSDRGGQATYHGPGQAVLYTLVDLPRRGLGVRHFVELLEDTVIALLNDYGVSAARRRGAPGVYVDGRKIAALGLRVLRGRCYHGLALNVNMDLRPFERIVVCGMTDMVATQLCDVVSDPNEAIETGDVGVKLARRLADSLSHPRSA